MTPPVVLTIAGSDSGGGAGIQGDLKTIAALGAYGVSVLTAVTAQNTVGVREIHLIPPAVVAAQLDAVLDDLPVAAVKVGMIGDPEVAEVVARRMGRLPHLVVDPVLVATSGDRLASVEAVAPLLAYAKVVTPNRQEAAALTASPCETAGEMVVAAGRIAAGRIAAGNVAAGSVAARSVGAESVADGKVAAAGPGSVVVTGSELAIDVLWHRGEVETLRGEPVPTLNNHGSGCTFSSAIAVRLAYGDPVPVAVRRAKRYVTAALAGGRDWRLGAGPGPLDHFARH